MIVIVPISHTQDFLVSPPHILSTTQKYSRRIISIPIINLLTISCCSIFDRCIVLASIVVLRSNNYKSLQRTLSTSNDMHLLSPPRHRGGRAAGGRPRRGREQPRQEEPGGSRASQQQPAASRPPRARSLKKQSA